MDLSDKWKKIKKSGSFYRKIQNSNKKNKESEVLELFGENPAAGSSTFMPCDFSSSDEFDLGGCSDQSSDEEFENHNNVLNLQDKLRSWAIMHNITHAALKDLLGMLKLSFPQLPKDPRTLMETPVQKTSLIELGHNGSYWHQGVEHCLRLVFQDLNHPLEVKINVNIDGLPVYKSSKLQFWPILFNVHQKDNIKPMVAGIFCGTSKPYNVVDFLTPFLLEMSNLVTNGIEINGNTLRVSVRAFICDSPARAFIKGVTNFNGQHGCLKCTTVGEYSYEKRCNIFPRTKCPKRTDDGFRKHHYEEHQKFDTPLKDLPIDLVEDIPVGDELHLLHLGIMKRFLMGFRDGTLGRNTKWSAMQISKISELLVEIKLPSEIHRSVRGLDCLAFWKGTEYRTFLMYLSIVVFKDFLPSHAYDHFVLLFCAVTICSAELYFNLLPVAAQLIEDFLENFKEIYGEHHMTSNVHNLIHLVDEVKRFGVLSSFSAYPFETMLGNIKRLLRGGANPLAQAARRIEEISKAKFDVKDRKLQEYPTLGKPTDINNLASNSILTHLNPEIVSNKIHISINFSLDDCFKNKWFLTTNKTIVAMHQAFKMNSKSQIIGFNLNNPESFFKTPIDSKFLNIFCSDNNNLNITTSLYSIEDILCKLVAVRYGDKLVLFPLIHSYQKNGL